LAKFTLKAHALGDLEARDDAPLDLLATRGTVHVSCILAGRSRIAYHLTRRWVGTDRASYAFVVTVQKESEVFVRVEDISLLEARQNFTIGHFPNGKVLIQRSLADCERRLDSSMFFRASKDCIVNLGQVKQSRLSKGGGLIFLLKDGEQVALSHRQACLFRKTRGL
jgi:DNA-binding LytR/AlgR family response regulator